MSPALELILVLDAILSHLLADHLPGLAPNRKVTHELLMEVTWPKVLSFRATLIHFLFLNWALYDGLDRCFARSQSFLFWLEFLNIDDLLLDDRLFSLFLPVDLYSLRHLTR